MVKKKRQNDPHDDDSSTDSGDEKTTNNSPGPSPGDCPHVNKAVELPKLRKILKASGLETEKCSKCAEGGADKMTPDSDGKTDEMFEYDKTLWLCLKCGTQLCGRSKNKHALVHFNTPRSDSHALALNTTTYEIWCYTCDNEVSQARSKKLMDCVECVKKVAQQSMVDNVSPQERNDLNSIPNKILATMDTIRPLLNDTAIVNNHQNSASTAGIASSSTTSVGVGTSSTGSLSSHPIPGFARRVNTVDSLPRVRGLSNLGNTCFFNAVMQCLAQTPYLLDVLREASEGGEQFVLPGGNVTFKDGQEIELPPIEGTLSSWGALTSALAETLIELQSGGGVYNPNKLFMKLTSKCPQFRGGDQHDSHELLRHLLESVRAEDLQRYQLEILSSLGYRKENINSVSDELKQKCKIYGQQAQDRILRPEPVFRGFLVSTLTCQDCFNTSSRHENFLDMSLPVSVEKAPPPIRRKSSPEPSSSSSAAPSRQQLKKEKSWERKAKRAAKQHSKRAAAQSLTIAIGPGGDAHPMPRDTSPKPTRNPETNSNSRSSSSSSSEQSDADVEDNLIDDVPKFNDGAQLINRTVPPLYDPNGNNEPLAGDPKTEKRGDSPENPNKDSNDDENDSGIATSPANTLLLESSDNRNLPRGDVSASPKNDNDSIGGSSVASASASASLGGNSVLELGISKKGATLVRQWTQPSENESTAGDMTPSGSGPPPPSLPTHELERMSLREKENSILAAKHKAKTKRIRTQSHSDWSTTIAPRYQCGDGECSIQSCLNNFTAVELMTGNNKVGCDACTKRINGEEGKTINTNATKQFLISSPPAVLILHLKRFQVGPRCMFQKLKRQVTFPPVLDIAPFCGSKVKDLPNIDRKQKKLLYALYGIVEHSGSMHGGHYVAYVKVRPKISSDDPRWKFLPKGSKAELDQTDEQRVKLEEMMARQKARELRHKENDSDDYTTSSSSSLSENDIEEDAQGAVGGSTKNDPEVVPPPGKWYHVSDSLVSEVPEETVLGAQAYLLFYERIY